MLLELLRPVGLMACMLALLAVMRAAFFGSETDIRQRMLDALGMLMLAAGVALVAGLMFRRDSAAVWGVLRTFPVRVFCWTAGLMAVLFVVAWWVEANCIFSSEMRF